MSDRSPAHHLRNLRRRRDHLKRRTEDPNRVVRGGGDFDKSEYNALVWAIDLLTPGGDDNAEG